MKLEIFECITGHQHYKYKDAVACNIIEGKKERRKDKEIMFNRWKEWFIKQVGDEEIGTFLAKRAASAAKGLNCINNERVCEVGKLDQEAQYEAQKSTGCCGFMDLQYQHYKSGRTFCIGFNYGH